MTPNDRLEIGGLSFHVTDTGEGKPVVLLHGFPDTSTLWRNQIPALSTSGFRVIAPDLRGRGHSDMPLQTDDYAFPYLIQDVVEVMDQLGIERACLVGHDWGASLAWALATFAPERVEKLVAISVGHPSAFMRPDLEQLRRSWYMWMFKDSSIAEKLLTFNDWKLFREWLDGDGDEQDYIESLSQPGRLTAGLNWYRANVNFESLTEGGPKFPLIKCPVLGIWSAKDFALTERQMIDSEEFVSGPWRYERFENSSHWIPLDEPEELNNLLLEFLAA